MGVATGTQSNPRVKIREVSACYIPLKYLILDHHTA